MKIIFIYFFSLSLSFSQNVSKTRPISTYSIIALDYETKEIGVAVQSHWFSVGFLVPWVKSGIGAVATQSFVKVDYGPEGLALMEEGLSANEALKKLINEDSEESIRQVGMVDINGNIASHTGNDCIAYADHVKGNFYSIQANMMKNSGVPVAMALAYESSKGDLAEKMLAALEAAENAGGDIRGKQSAAMVIASGEPTGVKWKDIELDLRVEDHKNPVKELKRLIQIHKAYKHANMGDYYVEKNQTEKALIEYNNAAILYPDNPELLYWAAIALINNGNIQKALTMFKEVFMKNENLRLMTPRLISSGLLKIDKDKLEMIMKQ